MTKDEALKLALEALEKLDGINTETECVTFDVGDAITAIKEALAQHNSVQEKKSTLTPKFVRIIDGVTCISLVEHEHIVNSLSQPEQEPVAWRTREVGGGWKYYGWKETGMTYESVKRINKNGFECEAIFATPPQPEQEITPIARHEANVQKFLGAPQPEQEPVALPLVQFEKVAEGIEVGYDVFGGVDIRLGGEFVYVHINYDYRYTHNAERKALAKQIVGLLTTPPQRTWVGLTDWEINSVANNNNPLDGIRTFARAIEAKLKEKNSA